MNITKPIASLAVAAILCAVVAVSYCVFRIHHEVQSPSVTLVSPDKQIRIELSEQTEETSPPTNRQSVARFTLYHNGRRMEDHETLLVDSPGLEFFSRYPKQVWVSNSILRLVLSAHPTDPMPAEVSVVNETDKVISYLRVMAGDMYLLTRLQPKSRTTFEAESVSSQRGELSFVSVIGRFEDRNRVPDVGVNFNVDGKLANPAHYSISISDAGVVITSQEFQKYSFSAKPTSSR